MRIIRKSELKGILGMLLVVLIIGIVYAGISGQLEQWGIPWFTGAKVYNKIVFISDRSGTREIYSMNLDGSDQKELTRGARVLSAPAVSPAANKIAFVGMSGNVSQVFAVSAAGGSAQPLTASSGTKRDPAYSPNGKHLAYIESGKVYVADLSGNNPDPVLPTHEEIHSAVADALGRGAIPVYKTFTWGPDSVSMAGVTNVDKIRDILVYLPAPEGETKKFAGGANDTVSINGMSWTTSQVKKLLVVSMDMSGTAVLAIFDADQKAFQPILQLKGPTLGAPAISPDGSVVVVPIKAPKLGSGLLKIDLQAERQGVICKGEFEKPVFSPRGDSIVAAQVDEKPGKRSIVGIDPVSGKVTVLADDGDCFDAAFTPVSEK